MKKRILSATLALMCAVTLLQNVVLAAEYPTVRTYNGQFTDINKNDWFYDEVAAAYSLGVISGASAASYNPNGNLSIAEAVKFAAVSHQLLTKGKVDEVTSDTVWYRPYLEYCKKNYIVTEDYPDYDTPALRAQVAVLFSRAITASGAETDELNEITPDVLRDVDSSDWYSGAAYRMYRWGIMTGDENGNLSPNDTIKRSEIAAVVMRVIDPDVRVRVGEEPEEPEEKPAEGATLDKIVLYDGSDSSASFAGITGFAANFSKSGGAWSASRSYSLNLIDDLVLEPDNISFKLRKGTGYEALGIVRGWLNATARGEDGEEVRDADAVRERLNELFYIWINERPVQIEEMWYADHGDYVTYAFYFGKSANLTKVETVDLMCGRLGSDIMAMDALSGIRRLLYGEDAEDTEMTPPADTSDIYSITVNDIRSSANEIIFEYECDRCAIIYGRGMYGGDSGEYRLLFVFRDGSTQTVYTQKLEDIRMNDKGNVLYYTVTAPDGELIQYGVNFK